MFAWILSKIQFFFIVDNSELSKIPFVVVENSDLSKIPLVVVENSELSKIPFCCC